ncbi:hypothetical protein OR571_10355 [Psychrobacillus sp. NEAU-3TGS]|uniref:hypothetical protein n=1 Tax=Psychrobacillus sp. NEAU-3TGS TaxID=2995412 RepID=UPI002496B920|nr:hypothetical protein [Psychrobacillus sp. NEAU-3TGS]MDI2587498.1 hypothetical protein [Psychrobacillus sp. NEAU-3TGS]
MVPTFTVSDIFVMMQTLNTKALIGFTDPFLGFSKEQIEVEWEKTYKKLHALELVRFSNGEIDLEEGFANALWIMSRTNLTVEILLDGEKKSLFYFSKNNVVECSQEADKTYTLYMHGAPSDTWNNVIYPRMLAGVDKQKVYSQEKVFVPTSYYNKWIRKGSVIDEQKLVQFNKNGDLKQMSKLLNHSIKNKIHNNRLIIFYKEHNEWAIEGLHVLTSTTSNWTFEMINKNNVELLVGKQSSSIEIVAEILDVLRRVQNQHEQIL